MSQGGRDCNTMDTLGVTEMAAATMDKSKCAGSVKSKPFENLQEHPGTNSKYVTSSPDVKKKASFFQKFQYKKITEPPMKRGRDEVTSPSSSSLDASKDKSFYSEIDIERIVESITQEKFEEMKEDINDLKQSIGTQDEDMEELRFENESLWNRVKLLEGRLARSEKIVVDLKEELLQTQSRQMKDNLIFYNIKENGAETRQETRKALLDFLKDEMKISSENMQKINIDKIHRLGQPIGGNTKPRSIVARFNPHTGREIVFDHIRNLDKKKKFGVSEQLPRELNERKKQLLPKFKEARAANKKTQWVGDKLIIEKKVHEVKKDCLMDINISVEDTALQLRKTTCPPKKYDGSTFQGHKVKIEGQDEVIPALHCIYKDSRVARATHNIYAYRIQGQGQNVTEHFEDDSEWGAGRILLKQLQESNSVNTLLCVTRWCGPRLLGKARFTHIAEAATQALAEKWVLTGEEDQEQTDL